MFTCIGAIFYEDLRSFEGQLYNTFKKACHACGLFQDDREWLLYRKVVVCTGKV